MQARSISPMRIRVGRKLDAQRQAEALPFAAAFAAPAFEKIIASEARDGARESGPFPTDVTLFAFLSQVLDDDPSCAAAVARVKAERHAAGLSPCSSHTSSYCKARERLPLGMLPRLSQQCAKSLEDDVPNKWLWHNRHVKIIDGTMLTAPDTPENRAAYPQHHAFKPGLGFPTLRLVALTSLATGAVVDAEIGPSRGQGKGELSLAHRLLRSVAQAEVVVGDRLFPGFPFVADVKSRGADFVGRLPRRIPHDFRLGVKLGPRDHLVLWKKPKSCVGMRHEDLADLPEDIRVREVMVTIKCPGGKSRRLRLVTTLLSRTEFPPETLAELYFKRWHIELDLRAIKQVLHLDVLRCQTPQMLHREIWAHILAYNVVRKLIAMAGDNSGVEPRRLSFKASVQALRAYKSLLPATMTARDRQFWLTALLDAIAQTQVGNRPGRREPRQIKRYPKKYDMLQQPRQGQSEALG